VTSDRQPVTSNQGPAASNQSTSSILQPRAIYPAKQNHESKFYRYRTFWYTLWDGHKSGTGCKPSHWI